MAPKKKAQCLNGHDLAPPNLTEQGRCRTCARKRSKDHREANQKKSPARPSNFTGSSLPPHVNEEEPGGYTPTPPRIVPP